MNTHRSTAWIIRLLGVSALHFALAGSAFAQSTVPIKSVPGFGPGIAGRISEGPIAPVCTPELPCTQPFSGARLLFLDPTTDEVVGEANSNKSGNFIVSVPQGDYRVRVQVIDFPRCPEQLVSVGARTFSMIHIDCDTRIR
ncbi:MAG: hypothetical protein PHE55_06060 [Methylococcaceae bacterium]|nr:hypothetical protein [Methylococcaceae bacterium]